MEQIDTILHTTTNDPLTASLLKYTIIRAAATSFPLMY